MWGWESSSLMPAIRQTYWRPLYPWCKQDWLPHLQLEEVPRDYQNCAPKLSLKCPQPQVVGYSQVSGCVDVVADKIPGLEPAKPAKSPSLQRNKEEVSLWNPPLYDILRVFLLMIVYFEAS
ncbi:Ubiquitin Carboxyl-Terminal Hydrolase 44 [Manis pentadactyla]|nr:Ubiquitin Carboxyl-Terminal Hydrolase 44 [Manis pentadactyla]